LVKARLKKCGLSRLVAEGRGGRLREPGQIAKIDRKKPVISQAAFNELPVIELDDRIEDSAKKGQRLAFRSLLLIDWTVARHPRLLPPGCR
jgi:hypothetical protein